LLYFKFSIRFFVLSFVNIKTIIIVQLFWGAEESSAREIRQDISRVCSGFLNRRIGARKKPTVFCIREGKMFGTRNQYIR
jgi:hypothetical protein